MKRGWCLTTQLPCCNVSRSASLPQARIVLICFGIVWSTYYQRFKHEMQRFHQHLVHTQNANHPKSTLQLRKENEQLRTLLHEEKRRTRLYERLLIDQLKHREEFRQKLLQELTKQTARSDVKLESFDFAIDYENDNIVFKIKPKDAANSAVVTKYCSDLSVSSSHQHKVSHVY